MSDGTLTQTINAVLSRAAADATLQSQLLANPVATLTANGVPLPAPPVGPNGESLVDQFNASLQDVLYVSSGVKRSWSPLWYGGTNSVACWACVIGVNVTIWGAITAATVAAVLATDGGALAPLLGARLGLPEVIAGTPRVVWWGQVAGKAARKTAAKAPFTVLMVGTFVNMLANMICEVIPNCCSAETAPDNGIWGKNEPLGDRAHSGPAAAVLTAGQVSQLFFAYQGHTNQNLWCRPCGPTGSSGPNWQPKSVNVPNTAMTHASCVTAGQPGAAAIGSTAVIAYLDADPKSATVNRIVSVGTTDFATWSVPAPISPAGQTVGNPALVTFGDRLICMYRDTGDRLYSAVGHPTGTNQVQWDAPVTISWATPDPSKAPGPVSTIDPGLGVFNGTLICGYKTSEGDGLRYTTSTDGSTWGAETWLPNHIIGQRPAFSQLSNQLMYLTESPADGHLCYATTGDLVSWSSPYRQESNHSSQPPALAGVGSSWYTVYKGYSDDTVYRGNTNAS